jgi:FkbM family methyltransferase
MIVGFEDYKNRYDFSDVTGVIHVGAHHGQEYPDYINTFGNIITHWFEPLDDAFNKLTDLLQFPNVYLYKYALGDAYANTEIFVDTGNGGQSSSLLKPKDHLNLFSHITFDNKQQVNVRPLDSFKITDSNVLVLDTQGYELKCLQGSIETLKSVKYVFCEYNTNEMYENCPSLDDLNNFLSGQGFSLQQQWITDSFWGDAFWSK